MKNDLKMESQEASVISNYFQQLLLRQGSGEYSFVPMFPKMWFVKASKSILANLEQLKGINVSFYFGDNDWIDTSYNGRK